MRYLGGLIILSVFAVIFFALNQIKSRFHQPALYFSDVNLLKNLLKQNLLSRNSLNENKTRPPKIRISNLPNVLAWLALFLFSLAFLDPHYYLKNDSQRSKTDPLTESLATEGVAIYLVLDKSGSMGQKVAGQTKIDRLKTVTQRFVDKRPDDLIGLVTFARGADVLSPLTLDHAAITEQLKGLTVVTDKEEDGTSIGYAIYKTANLIAATRHFASEGGGEPDGEAKNVSSDRASYDIKGAVMILITDGFQAPSQLDAGRKLRNIEVDEAAKYAKDKGIRLYVINVEPRFAEERFSAYKGLMEKVTQMTGGQFFLVDEPNKLEKIYGQIDQMEKSVISQQVIYGGINGEISQNINKSEMPHLYRRVSFYPYLIFLGLLCLFVSAVLETTILRRVP